MRKGPEIRDAYDSETKHQIGAFLGALGAVPLLFFAGYFRAVLRQLHPSGRLSANVALAGAVVVATGLAVQSLIHAALAEAAQTSEFSDQALQALNALDGWSFYPIAIGLSTFLLACGVALLRGRRFFAPFLAWAAVVLGVLGARSDRRILRRDLLRDLACGHQPDAVRTLGGRRSPMGRRRRSYWFHVNEGRCALEALGHHVDRHFFRRHLMLSVCVAAIISS